MELDPRVSRRIFDAVPACRRQDARPDRLVVAVSVAVIALGVLLSLLGPCHNYTPDTDRDFQRTRLLLDGQLELALIGHDAAIFGRTLSGVFYLILAPVMLLSRNPAWLFAAVDVIILLGLVPLWHICRRFFDREQSWVAVACFAVSSGRICYSNQAQYLHIAFAAAWHMMLLAYLVRPSARILSVLGLGLLVLLSLRLSALPLVVGLAFVFAGGRFARTSGRRSLVALASLAGAVVATALLYDPLRNIVVGRLGSLSAPELWARGRHALLAMGEQTGFVADLSSASLAKYCLLPLVAIGLATTATSRRYPSHRLTDRSDRSRKKLLAGWVAATAGLQLPAAMLLVNEWDGNHYADHHYRHLIPCWPALHVLTMAGLFRVVCPPRRRLRTILTLGALCLVAAGHVAAVSGVFSRAPSRFSRNVSAGYPRSALVSDLLRRWRVGPEWLPASVYYEPGIMPLGRYLLDYLAETASGNDEVDVIGPRYAVYVVRRGGEPERRLLAERSVAASAGLGGLRGYLCPRRPEDIATFNALGAVVPSRSRRDYAVDEPCVAVEADRRRNEMLLLVHNARPPERFHAEILYDVQVADRNGWLVVAAGVARPPWVHYGDNDVLRRPYVRLVSSKPGRSAVVELHVSESPTTIELEHFTWFRCRTATIAALPGWRADQLSDVRCGFEDYSDPSHPSSGGSAEWSVLRGGSALPQRRAPSGRPCPETTDFVGGGRDEE